MVELVTDRLVIATPGESHIDDVFRIMSTRCLAERTGFKKMDDVSEAEGKIRWAMRTDNMLIISRKDEDNVIGIIILTPKEINLPQGTLVDYEICYFIETSFQGNGYMTEALAYIRNIFSMSGRRTGSQSILSQTTDRQERWPWREDSSSATLRRRLDADTTER